MSDLDAFLHKPGFARLWPLVLQKYVSLGRVAGRVSLSDVTAEEREALAGLLALNLHGQTRVTISLPEVDRALQDSRFAVSLEECLTQLYPDDLTPARAVKAAEAERYHRFVEWAQSLADDTRLEEWMRAMGNPLRRPLGYRTFLRCFQEDYDPATGTSQSVAHALAALERQMRQSGVGTAEHEGEGQLGVGQLGANQGQSSESHTDASYASASQASESRASESSESRPGIRLPILAAEVMGDPHGLDTNALAGRLFLWGMLHAQQADGGTMQQSELEVGVAARLQRDRDDTSTGEQDSESGIDLSSESIRSVYERFGVTLDDISSTVYVAGWPGLSITPIALTLFTVSSLDLGILPASGGEHSVGIPRVVFAVENPSIFGAIIDSARATQRPLPHPIMCPSGQPSIAALRLCDAVCEAGGIIYYSGDMDVKGLQIAENLALRCHGQLRPWRMSAPDYLEGLRDDSPCLSETELRQLTSRLLPWEIADEPSRDLGETTANGSLYAAHSALSTEEEPLCLRAEMLRCGRKVFQENLAAKLIADYWNFSG
ncbi:TIGR02679 domain-containing protein [Alicyclobacillus sp. ALC3]|uniref:TIGR02679 domain-containing protein n=1 Tax=Alicyclobacillus sp. ALC3 TaxID=2796143 RepID=UPI00237922F6|nr:TIGR02679 domain-containing protein [Alicyclobacillus sp. ALC3]WDL98628.1 DUF2399 domain-containing protein [Alicyclobacillus sp. ALC3]